MAQEVSRRWVGALVIFCLAPFCFALRASAGTFKNPIIVPTSTDPLGIAAADLNNDGKPDLVYMDGARYGQQTLHILLGNGNGTFTHGQDFSLPADSCCVITIADVTGDGIPDIVLGGAQQTKGIIDVLIGNGDGTFQTPVISTYQVGNSTVAPYFNAAIGVGDINGDGNVDLVLPDAANNTLDLLLGDGKGNFTLSSTMLAYMKDAVYLSDLNGDGKLDIVATDLIGADFLVYLGNGDGTFQNYVRYTGQPSTDALILTDVDGDGHPDMLTQYTPNQVAYFKGNPDGTFGTLTSIPSANSPNPLARVGDFNSDGVPDLLFATPTGIGTELASSSLNYTPIKQTVSGRTPPPPYTPLPPITADFNSDGHLDVAMGVEGGIAILLGNGDGTFASADSYDMGQEVGAAAVADFNGDGKPDIAVTLPAMFPRLLVGNGTGTFTLGPDPNSSYASSGAYVTAVVGDFNGDGKKDLDIGNMEPNTASSPSQFIAFGKGDGSFQTPASIVDSSPVVADVNGDGRSDMVYLGTQSIIVSLGQANGTFNDVITPLRLTDYYGQFNVGDVNHDGRPDLVINYSNHIEIWLGNGDGSFTYFNSASYPGLSYAAVEAIADLDGDGNADIVFGPGQCGEPLTILYGNGDGTFQAPVFLPISHCYTQVTVADVNGDNKPDLVMTDGAGIAVMLNLGGRKFDSEVDYVGGASISALNVVDVNGDGFPDIVAANTGGTTVTVLLNEPNGTSPEGAPVSGAVSVSPASPVEGQSIAFSLTVAGPTAGSAVPTGTVNFYVDGAFQATVPLTNGTAKYNFTGTLLPIQHTVVATYNGDSVYAPRSFSALFTVQPPTYATTTTLTASPLTLLASQTVRVTATVSAAVSIPTGVVTFFDGTQVIGSVTINSNDVAYFDTALLGAGVHSLTATYNGITELGYTGGTVSYVGAIFSPSTSAPVAVTVNANATATSLSAAATSVTAGTVATFTASVNSTGGTPFGGVSFYDGTTLLGTMGLDANASASFSTASLAAGTHTIVASFNTNATFSASSSAPLTVTVTAAATTLAATTISLDPEMNSARGGSMLVADVSALSGSPEGMVTFLDNGAILGKGLTDSSGRATIAMATMPSGPHDFTASFGGAPGFAPSVSPELRDEWPATGPGFGLAAGSEALSLSASVPESLSIRVTPLGGFQQTVEMSCASGLPAGYVCSFSPASLDGGTSILTISAASRAAAAWVPESTYLQWLAVSLLLLALLCLLLRPLVAVAERSRRLRKALLLAAVCLAFGALGGCAANFATRQSILTVQAKSGTGAQTIIHSAQVTLRFH